MSGIKKAAKELQKLGRRGDSMLAHITKREADLLKKHGGSGTRNPKTGLMEFWLDDPDDNTQAEYPQSPPPPPPPPPPKPDPSAATNDQTTPDAAGVDVPNTNAQNNTSSLERGMDDSRLMLDNTKPDQTAPPSASMNTSNAGKTTDDLNREEAARIQSNGGSGILAAQQGSMAKPGPGEDTTTDALNKGVLDRIAPRNPTSGPSNGQMNYPAQQPPVGAPSPNGPPGAGLPQGAMPSNGAGNPPNLPPNIPPSVGDAGSSGGANMPDKPPCMCPAHSASSGAGQGGQGPQALQNFGNKLEQVGMQQAGNAPPPPNLMGDQGGQHGGSGQISVPQIGGQIQSPNNGSFAGSMGGYSQGRQGQIGPTPPVGMPSSPPMTNGSIPAPSGASTAPGAMPAGMGGGSPMTAPIGGLGHPPGLPGDNDWNRAAYADGGSVLGSMWKGGQHIGAAGGLMHNNVNKSPTSVIRNLIQRRW